MAAEHKPLSPQKTQAGSPLLLSQTTCRWNVIAHPSRFISGESFLKYGCWVKGKDIAKLLSMEVVTICISTGTLSAFLFPYECINPVIYPIS